MARTRADLMAAYLEELVRQGGGAVEIQRGALAARFGCAPSQVNYVLATRFTLDRGYVLESRSGQGGYIRVRVLSVAEWRLLMPQAARFDPDETGAANPARSRRPVPEMALSQDEALEVTRELRQAGLITEREAGMLRFMLTREVLGVPLPERDRLRARLVRAAVLALMPGVPGAMRPGAGAARSSDEADPGMAKQGLDASKTQKQEADR